MPIITGHVTLGTGATLIYKADADGCGIWIHDDSANPVFLGDGEVTTSTGLEVEANLTIGPISLTPGTAIYGCSASGNDVISYLIAE